MGSTCQTFVKWRCQESNFHEFLCFYLSCYQSYWQIFFIHSIFWKIIMLHMVLEGKNYVTLQNKQWIFSHSEKQESLLNSFWRKRKICLLIIIQGSNSLNSVFLGIMDQHAICDFICFWDDTSSVQGLFMALFSWVILAMGEGGARESNRTQNPARRVYYTLYYLYGPLY